MTFDNTPLSWKNKAKEFFRKGYTFEQHYHEFLERNKEEQIPIAWTPEQYPIISNLAKSRQTLGVHDYQTFFNWSIQNKEEFWQHTLAQLQIKFQTPPMQIKGSGDSKAPKWLKGAKMNVVESCLKGKPQQTAIFCQNEGGEVEAISYQDLPLYLDHIIENLHSRGLKKGDRITLYMPFNANAIICYLAVIKAGMQVVSVADSFSQEELKRRMKIVGSTTLITQTNYRYNNKIISLQEKVDQLDETQIFYFKGSKESTIPTEWHELASEKNENKQPFEYGDSDSIINILFSSGTTSEPKAIPWTQITPIKSASDGYYHQDIQEGDVISWTTGMGWMMAPWLIFAGLINNATVAVFEGSFQHEKFPQFLVDANINILGTIPSIVRAWKKSKLLENNQLKVRVWSSTGEPSNQEDYLYLMYLSQYDAPIIEYCGGTEIGGGYITGTVEQPSSPAIFTTPALGLDFLLINREHQPDTKGEVFLLPPSIGLSETLLNKNHEETYFQHQVKIDNLIIRKHGDAYQKIESPINKTSFYRCLGRVDDNFNLGGVKVSAVEIESAIIGLSGIKEVAATVRVEKGVSYLIIHLIPVDKPVEHILRFAQKELREKLNPLFKIHEVVWHQKFPRTASGKLIRRAIK